MSKTLPHLPSFLQLRWCKQKCLSDSHGFGHFDFWCFFFLDEVFGFATCKWILGTLPNFIMVSSSNNWLMAMWMVCFDTSKRSVISLTDKSPFSSWVELKFGLYLQNNWYFTIDSQSKIFFHLLNILIIYYWQSKSKKKSNKRYCYVCIIYKNQSLKINALIALPASLPLYPWSVGGILSSCSKKSIVSSLSATHQYQPCTTFRDGIFTKISRIQLLSGC